MVANPSCADWGTVEIDAENDRIKIPVKLAVAVAAGFLFWYLSTYIIPLTNEIVTLREHQARDQAEHEAMRARIDRLEDRVNARTSN